ncbi:MAG: Stp1/IreP family PP2C-type Ser/Thr phosphatase [Thermoleophilia bacterium]|nr:Stp1/IreP family PP2C-type Ser/Thr phosphatase [Thermoleophilia bacterium]
MKVGERAGVTDAGRKRRRNEDSFVVDPPLFAVADGMGGAQAGEVASRLAAAVFREYHGADELEPAERVQAIIQEANRRIFERSRADTAASGMGTTVTAAIVGGQRIVVGHVGDSRAYRVRDGELHQLTEDHSLVADLVRSGRLTPEEADAHPQRSVITRALGTDPEVDVDTCAVEAQPGDVYLLCSDGLTTMVGDDEILRVLAESRSLEAAGKALVKAANRHGGDDNVTVVLFAVEDGEPDLGETARIDSDGRGDTQELEDTLTGLAPVAPPERPAQRPGGADERPAASARAAPRPGARKGRSARRVFIALAALVFLGVLLLAAFWGLANAHFVGAEEDGHVAVYQGLPYDLGGGISLYRARYVSPLLAAQLSERERRRLFDHDLMSYEDARRRIAGYEEEAVP